MHRSGTSLVASVLQNAGVDIGINLMTAAKGNPRGHFEDLDFFSFHDEVLRRNNKTFLVEDMDGLKDFSPTDTNKADKLIQNRSLLPIWGWKDPRTSLFLEFWNQRVPHAFFIFLYRHPIATTQSLLRRGAVYPENDAQAGLTAWCIYNQEILQFINQNPNQCFLGNIESVAQNFPYFISKINDKFGLTLKQQIDLEIFHPDELSRNQYDISIIDAFRQITPKAFLLYDQLEAASDISGSGELVDDDFDKSLSDAIRIVISKQLSEQEEPGAKLNYLFSFIDPGIANSRAISLNSCILEIRNLESSVQTIATQIRTMATQIAERDASLHSLATQLAEWDALAKSLASRLAEREAMVQSLSSRLAEEESLAQSLSAQVDQLKPELEQTKTEAVNYVLSGSWRMTRPFRKMHRFIKGEKNV